MWSIQFVVSQDLVEPFEEVLSSFCESTTFFEASGKDRYTVTGYCLDKPSEIVLGEKFGKVASNLSCQSPSLIIEELPDIDWVTENQKNFPPIEVGMFYVYGSHVQNAPPEGKIKLKIDAATAFGTGEHYTTSGCLRAIESLYNQGFVPRKPIDIGTGTGILAMAIARCWNIPVLATDIDPEAVRVAQQNAEINQLDDLIILKMSDGVGGLNDKYDLIVANILAGPLCDIASDVATISMQGASLILSGILNTQAEMVIEAYQKAGFKHISQKDYEDWCVLVLQFAGKYD